MSGTRHRELRAPDIFLVKFLRRIIELDVGDNADQAVALV
jgi:hypothetical protein